MRREHVFGARICASLLMEKSMKPLKLVYALFLFVLAVSTPALPQEPVPPKADEVLAIMKKVAGWQMANPSSHSPTDWTQGVYYTGMMALYNVSKEQPYLDA